MAHTNAHAAPVEQILEVLRIRPPVDLVDLRRVGESLLGQILKYGKRISGSDTAYAEPITRRLFDPADFVPYLNCILAERRKHGSGNSRTEA